MGSFFDFRESTIQGQGNYIKVLVKTVASRPNTGCAERHDQEVAVQKPFQPEGGSHIPLEFPKAVKPWEKHFPEFFKRK